MPSLNTLGRNGDHAQTVAKPAAKNGTDGAAAQTAPAAGPSSATVNASEAAAGIAAGNGSQHVQSGPQSGGTSNGGMQNGTAHKDSIENGSQSSGTQSNGSQTDSQTTQHPQADATQPNQATPRPSDIPVGQPQLAPVQATTGAAGRPAAVAASTAGAGSAPGTVRPSGEAASALAETDEPVSASGINAAKLLQTISGTEMRVGMNSTDFGNISIRAELSQQQMMAQISLDHSDLSQAIAAHIATAQTKLSAEYGLHASIELSQQGASFSGGSASSQPGSGGAGNSAQREQRDFIRSSAAEIAPAATEMDFGLGHAALASTGNGTRLDINA